jgi:cyanate permease
VTACMNTFANIGGAIGPLVMGYSVQWFGSWSIPLLITSAVYVCGGVFALLVNPGKPLDT